MLYDNLEEKLNGLSMYFLGTRTVYLLARSNDSRHGSCDAFYYVFKNFREWSFPLVALDINVQSCDTTTNITFTLGACIYFSMFV
jgi:hypothetical protein